MQSIVVGIDGGGSKTRAVLADEHGQTLAEATGAGSAVRPNEIEESAGIIAGVVRDVLEEGERGDRPGVLCVGVAGAGREPERQALWDALITHEIAEEVVVLTDFAVALEDAFGEGPGVLLIAGTGSAAFGRGPAGVTSRCGGWGPAFGDEGGGAWIGRRALSVVAAAADGREPETALTGAILTATEVAETADLIRWAAAATPAALASLAPIVLTVANSGDLRANSIVSLAVEELALHVRSLARHLFTDERASVPVALTGGLLSKSSPLRKRLEHRLKAAVPGAHVHPGDVDAARGAVRIAVRMLGASATKSSLP
ncbi:MAG: BadF/BadG/BcrA/BcrD ATPase family protein [Gemmatimonadaceae bacterium]